MPRRGRTIVRGRRKRGYQWTFSNDQRLGLSAGVASGALFTAGDLSETLERTRGELLIYVDGAQAPGGLTLVSVGLYMAPEDTTTATATPHTDPDFSRWLWRGDAFIGYEEMVTDVVDVPVLTAKRFTIDSKARRIVKPQDVLMWSIESTTIGTALAVNVAIAVSALTSNIR